MQVTEWLIEAVRIVRLELYNREEACGATAIRRRLEEVESIIPAPSVRTIGRILASEGLTHGRTGWYEGEEGCPWGSSEQVEW